MRAVRPLLVVCLGGVACSGGGSVTVHADSAVAVDAPTVPSVPPDVSAIPADATTTGSGLAYRILQPGRGTRHPAAIDTVQVNYSGWTTDGHLLDSSVVRGQPTSFPLNGVISGWREGIQLMVVGEKTRFWIPAELAYGATPDQPGRPAGTLVFDIELIEFH